MRILDTRGGTLQKTTLETALQAIEFPMSATEITDRLDALVQQRFVVRDEGYYLSAVLPLAEA